MKLGNEHANDWSARRNRVVEANDSAQNVSWNVGDGVVEWMARHDPVVIPQVRLL